MQGNAVSRKFLDENQQRAVAGTPPTCMKPAGEFLRLDLLTAFTYLSNNICYVDMLLLIVVKVLGKCACIAAFEWKCT
jgi:hypothetical protein